MATARAGAMSPPLIGGFIGGNGEFIGRETMDGRDVLVRFLITCDGADTIRFQQAFSVDEGATWETNLDRRRHAITAAAGRKTPPSTVTSARARLDRCRRPSPTPTA